MSLTSPPPRRRDRILGIFSKTHSPSPTRPTTASFQTQAQIPANKRNGNDILVDVVEALTSEDRETLHGLLLPTNADSIDTAFDEVYNCTRQLQQRCVGKKWSWNYKGREVYLFDQVGKIVQLLERFKAAGDVVANVDPVHIGLPWAGIRAILEVAIADNNQRAVLVTGTELALYMGNRLKAYVEIFAHLSSSLATDNFRKALVNLYAYILGFLAQAIRVQQKRSISRVAQILWNSATLTQFEGECDILCVRASEEARICDSEVGARWREGMNARLSTLDRIHNLAASLTKLQEKADLAKLVTAKDATYDSSAEGGLPRCLPGTRVVLLREIIEWSINPQAKRIFWLCGKAGIGKSTISRTVAEHLDAEGRLGASFFFKRGHADRSHANLFFPTIAKQLADKLPGLGHAIAAALEDDSLLCEKHMTKQFDKLLLQPIQTDLSSSALLQDRFLVLDALDECEDPEQVETLLKLLKRLEEVSTGRIRILVTSRPDPPLLAGFSDMSNGLLYDVQVEKAQVMSIRSDLNIFFHHELGQITEKYKKRNVFSSLPSGWVEQSDIDLLVDKSHPLFIVAFTLCKLLSLSHTPQADLRILLAQPTGHGLSTGLGAVYLPVLRQTVTSASEQGEKDKTRMFRMIIGSLILLFNPLSATSLSNLLDTSIEEVGSFVPPLQSVLNLAETSNGVPDPLGPIKLFHLSFRDFLIDPDLAKDNESKHFWIDEAQAHRKLANHCLRLLSYGALTEDLCDVKAPGTRRAAVSRPKVAEHLPEEVAYACCYWVKHIEMSREHLKDNGAAHQFLQKHLLHWMEALSWLGKVSDVIHILDTLKSIVAVDQGEQLLALLDDASRFALRHRYIIDEAPLQTYMSALLFTPSLSKVRQIFGSGLQIHFESMPQVPQHWGAEKQKLEGHEGPVTTVAFSPDGKMVASGSDDMIVRLFDATTGDERRKLEGHDGIVSAVAFSPDGKTVASGSWDKTVRMWDAATGEQRRKLGWHDGIVSAVAFSPDGKTVASGSYDMTVRLLDVTTGKERRKLGWHDGIVSAVAFSPDGKTVASGSYDMTVRLLDATTGDERRKLEGHDHGITAVTFSPDGKTVASGSRDKTVRLWNAVTGDETHKLEGHGRIVSAVAFSPDGKTVASGSRDKTVRLFNVTTGKERRKLGWHDGIVSAVAFSPDGKTVASGSDDMTVRLLDVTAAQEKQKLEGHDGIVSAVAFSPDGKTVASGSRDKTVRLWDAMTGEGKQKLEGHDGIVSAVAFSPDGKTVASGSDDMMVRLFDVTAGEEQQKYKTARLVRKIRFSRDGSALHTNIGQLDLGIAGAVRQSSGTESRSTIFLDSSWIKRDGMDLLWLPHEYRGTCHGVFGSSLVIGQVSGAVSFLSFR